MNKPALIELILPPLLSKWELLLQQGCADLLPPLLECITSFVQAVGTGACQYCCKIYRAALELLANTYETYASSLSWFAKTPLVVSILDLLSAISVVSGSDFIVIVRTVKTSKERSVIEFLNLCTVDTSPQVRQSACALLGETAKGCGQSQHLTAVLESFLPLVVSNLHSSSEPLRFNASWAIGQLAARIGESSMDPFVGPVMVHLIPIIHDNHLANPSMVKSPLNLEILICFNNAYPICS